jgi:Tfp pilus assembly protein PilO
MNSRVLPLLAILIAGGIFFAYINPAWTGSIAETKAAIASDNQALQAASQYAAQQNQLAAARDAVDPSDLARLNALLPSSVDNVGLILDLNALAARSGLALSNIDVVMSSPDTGVGGALPASGASPTGSVDLSLSAVGTYPALQAFLAGVERSQRLLDVRDLMVKGSDTGVYSYKMSLRFYWLR